MKTVVLDCGHGDHDPGAISPHTNQKEKDATLHVGLHMRDLLHGSVRVLMTREDDTFLSPSARRAFSDMHDADLFLSIHANSAERQSASGGEIWTSRGQTRGDKFATTLGTHWMRDFPDLIFRRDHSDGDLDKESNFSVLLCNAPAALMEIGFLSNVEDSARMQNPFWLDKAAESLAGGVLAHLGLDTPAVPTPAPIPGAEDALLSLDNAIDRLRLTREKMAFILHHPR